jgi:hypothetical protein
MTDPGMIMMRFPEKCHPCSLGLNLHFVSPDKGLGNQAFFVSLFENCHPRLQTPGYQKPHSALVGLREGPEVELPGLILNFVPVGLFSLHPLIERVRVATRLSGPFFTTCYI